MVVEGNSQWVMNSGIGEHLSNMYIRSYQSGCCEQWYQNNTWFDGLLSEINGMVNNSWLVRWFIKGNKRWYGE